MEVRLFGKKPNKVCFIRATEHEALLLIQSLTNQLISKNPNSGRLESFCDGDVAEMTIAVHEKIA